MKFEEAKLKAISLEYAVSLIKNNNSQSYIWYSVRNKKKILIEVGGTKGEIKAYIPNLSLAINIASNGIVTTKTNKDITDK